MEGFPLSLVTVLLISAACADTEVASAAKCANAVCDMPKHYGELACVPIRQDGECCPIRYDCDHLKAFDMNKCYYKGNEYADQQMIPDKLTNANCMADCRCRDGTFKCAYVECPELVFQRPEPHCVIQETNGQCCSSNIVCDRNEIEALPKCYLDGKMYHKGQRMYPESNGCHTCLCTEDFNNQTAIASNAACKEINCGIDLSHVNKIRSGCVPVYYKQANCCPIEMKCPDKLRDKKVISQGRKINTNPNMKCKFGRLTLEIGDMVTDPNKCTVCKCSVPPMITCIQQDDCQKSL